MTTSCPQLLLARHAETAWVQVIRPWMEQSHLGLSRSFVVVPTRGQAQGLKQRCVAEGVPLLGVEFLSPGLARQKWLPLAGGKPGIGRELLLFELRWLVARRLASLPADAAGRGVLKSLQSDAERALDDFDELLKAGRGPADFELEGLRSLFGDLLSRVSELGYSVGSVESRRVAEKLPVPGERLDGRLLVHGLSAEGWGEYHNVAALVRRFEEVTVVLPEPEFRGRRALDEAWVEVWQSLLRTEALPIDAEEPALSCEAVAGWWSNERSPAEEASGARARILVGRTRLDEMTLVADEVVRLLRGETGTRADNVAVVFPKADAAHLCLMRLLEARGVPFVNLLPGVGGPAQETQILRGVIGFYAKGGRLDELLELWPLLKAAGLVKTGLAPARRVLETLFEERQRHALEPCLPGLEEGKSEAWKEVARVARLLVPVWPDEMTLTEALKRLEALREPFLLAMPPNWPALDVFARRETAAILREELCELLLSFLPEQAPVSGRAKQAGFAPVTLTTRRRAEGLAWSHLILVESNAGVWPRRITASGWLTDEHRNRLNLQSGTALGLFSSEDRAWLEKRSYAALARDTREEVVFSAALADEADLEMQLAPNSWLERALWRIAGQGTDIQRAFEGGALGRARPGDVADEVSRWRVVWQGRRDPQRPFDEYFFSVDPKTLTPDRLSARQIEAGIQDPATLWFEAILKATPTERGALMRKSRLVLGKLVHRVLSAALRGAHRENEFFPKPEQAEVERRLGEELQRIRALWPADCYWDSFHGELAQECLVLVKNLYALTLPEWLATERWLPGDAILVLPEGCRIGISGRMDLVCADREDWPGATVQIVDFKTGGDTFSARQMASRGAGLQLGIYLEVARQLGAAAGQVWMVKPKLGETTPIDLAELGEGLAGLGQLEKSLRTGCYGALTKDRKNRGAPGATWPLACAPIGQKILASKFSATHGLDVHGEEGENDE